jgi:hypothetical protein
MSSPATPALIPSEFPCQPALVQAAKFAMELDRPILLDYFTDSFNGKAVIGEHVESKERILVKAGGVEFTSLISKLYKVGADIIILTENSIYVVSGKISKKTLTTMPKNDEE